MKDSFFPLFKVDILINKQFPIRNIQQNKTMKQISEVTQPFSSNFGYVMVIGALIALEILVFARIFGGMSRKVYSKQFMVQHFGKLHQDLFEQEIGGGGHPDTGSGYYSQKLAYKDWYQFNNSQRVHMHFVEWIASYLFLLVCGGVYFPITSASIGLGIFIVRILYGIGYVIQGPRGRVIPFVINVILTSGLGIVGILSGVQHILREN